jgi:MerR family transcriptional regulator/heat shock protein HspR
MSSPFDMSDRTPVYVISVAAELSGMHPQTLRTYDKAGLVSPGRSAGGGRRYSLRDILLLREVQRLSQEGIIPAVKRILELESELERFRAVIAELSAERSQLRDELESTRAVAARLAGLLRSSRTGGSQVPVHQGGGQPGPAGQPDTGRQTASDEPGPDLPAAATAPDSGTAPRAEAIIPPEAG